jgi:hypothetical protein
VGGNSYAHIPDVPLSGQYRLGVDVVPGPDDFYWNTTLDDGTVTAAEEPDGWEGLSFQAPIDQATGRDGGLVGPTSVGPRRLPIRAVLVAPDGVTLRRQIRRLRMMLGPRKRVIWEQNDFGEDARMGLVCVPDGDFQATPTMGHAPGGVAVLVSFVLLAANPVWKFATDGVDPGLELFLPAGLVSGRTYSKTFSYTYGAVISPGGSGTAINRGDIETWPTFEVTGPADFPTIYNETTGKQFTINQNIPTGSVVTVDARTGVVTPQLYNLINRPFSLLPGSNTIRWKVASGVFNSTARLRVRWLSNWQ